MYKFLKYGDLIPGGIFRLYRLLVQGVLDYEHPIIDFPRLRFVYFSEPDLACVPDWNAMGVLSATLSYLFVWSKQITYVIILPAWESP